MGGGQNGHGRRVLAEARSSWFVCLLPSRSSARLDELEARAVRHCPLPPPKAISADDGGVAAFIATFASGIMVKALTKVYP